MDALLADLDRHVGSVLGVSPWRHAKRRDAARHVEGQGQTLARASHYAGLRGVPRLHGLGGCTDDMARALPGTGQPRVFDLVDIRRHTDWYGFGHPGCDCTLARPNRTASRRRHGNLNQGM